MHLAPTLGKRALGLPMDIHAEKSITARLGFHYFPDTIHYSASDLDTWLPELKAMGASWLTLLAPTERAIPEFFVRSLLREGITPILHFLLPTDRSPSDLELDTLFHHYARWGVKYVVLYDRPNIRQSWPASVWARTDLVERFLDYFLPIAEQALDCGLIPVFPPLEPGGDYWDLSFLRTSLRGIQRRVSSQLLDDLVLGVYAWTGENPLDWGFGGGARWPGTRPYFTPPDMQDHLGFRIFDWYLEIAQQELGKRLPVLALRAGVGPACRVGESLEEGLEHTRTILALAHLVSGVDIEGKRPHPIPPELLACNIWLLSAGPQSVFAPQAWYQPDGEQLAVVKAFRQWVAEFGESRRYLDDLQQEESVTVSHKIQGTLSTDSVGRRPIDHYVLLPLYAWGAAEWDLAAIQPLLRESHPTIGFSLAEARMAARVTVVGGEGAVSEQAMGILRSAGCKVERLEQDGIHVAT